MSEEKVEIYHQQLIGELSEELKEIEVENMTKFLRAEYREYVSKNISKMGCDDILNPFVWRILFIEIQKKIFENQVDTNSLFSRWFFNEVVKI